jgi:O-antigen/teichoic acid export membrane protein
LAETAEETVGGALFLFSGSTVATVIAALGSIIVARLLGPELYGIFSLSLVVPGFLLLFTDFGISSALTRFSAKLRAEGNHGLLASLIKDGFIFEISTTFIVLFLGLLFSDMLAALIINRPELGFIVKIAVFFVLFSGLSSTVNSTLIGFEDMRSSALLSVTYQLARAVLTPLLIVVGFSVLGAVVGYIASNALAAALGTLIILKHYRKLNVRSIHSSVFPNLRMMMGYGLPLYLSSALSSILVIYRGIILAYFMSNFVIGNFGIALNFLTLLTLLSGPVATTLFPAFSKFSAEAEEAKRMFKYSVKYTAALIVPVSAFTIFMSKDLVSVIYGSSYVLAPLFLALYAITYLYAGFGSIVLGPFFQGIGETKVNLKSTIIYAIVFLPLALLLTKNYGVLGLIASILLSSLASLAYSLAVATRKFSVSVDLSSSLRVYAASAISATPLLLLTIYSPFPSLVNLFIGSAVYLMLYLTLMPLIGGTTKTDVENFRLMFRGVKLVNPVINLILNYETKLARH